MKRAQTVYLALRGRGIDPETASRTVVFGTLARARHATVRAFLRWAKEVA